MIASTNEGERGVAEVKSVTKYYVGGVEFETLDEAKVHSDQLELVSEIETRCADYIYRDGDVVKQSVADMVIMLNKAGFEVVRK